MTHANQNKEFEIRGVNHLALVCKDMARTVDFYTNVLGMPLVKTLDLPGGAGQHFFFDIGKGDTLAFFWFPQKSESAPGIASPQQVGEEVEMSSVPGSMNHVAFDVPPEKIEAYMQRLREKGVAVTEVVNHDHSPSQVSAEVNDDTWIRSVYFFDPDGILLEFAAWTKELAHNAPHPPAAEADRSRYLREQAHAGRRSRMKLRT